MKRKICYLAAALVSAAFISCLGPDKEEVGISAKPQTVPELRHWKPDAGVWKCGKSIRIRPAEENDTLRQVATMLSSDMNAMFGTKASVSARNGDIILAYADEKDRPDLGAEGYMINIDRDVRITAGSFRGLLWGTRTLLQMLELSDDMTLPCGEIYDRPEYRIRGMHLDCGRKYIPMTYLRELVKVLSYYKMNTLQIHLNDNGAACFFDDDWDKTYAAFRLESERYPGLTAKDGSYSKEEFRNFQKEAATYGVEVIPEIDIPAHSLAFTHYMPEIGSTTYGMDHLDLFNPKTYEFLDNLFDEYLSGDDPVFLGGIVHVGTDEYNNSDPKVVEQFRYFTDHYIRLVESYGKQACVWGSLTQAPGQTPVKADSVIIDLWNPQYADPDEMIDAGYELISIPGDYAYIVPSSTRGNNLIDNEYIYELWTPMMFGYKKMEGKNPAVIGGMFGVWNDYVGNGISVKDIHWRLFPSLQTFSAKTWSADSTSLAYPEFRLLCNGLSEAPDVNELGTIPHKTKPILHMDEVNCGTDIPLYDAGYDYFVKFRINAADEIPGTILFRNDDAVFYLSSPGNGNIGFSRDGYDYTFDYRLTQGNDIEIAVSGTQESTDLYVNGKLIDSLDQVLVQSNFIGQNMMYVSTLVFPFEKSGDFKSRITDLVVYQYQQ